MKVWVKLWLGPRLTWKRKLGNLTIQALLPAWVFISSENWTILIPMMFIAVLIRTCMRNTEIRKSPKNCQKKNCSVCFRAIFSGGNSVSAGRSRGWLVANVNFLYFCLSICHIIYMTQYIFWDATNYVPMCIFRLQKLFGPRATDVDCKSVGLKQYFNSDFLPLLSHRVIFPPIRCVAP